MCTLKNSDVQSYVKEKRKKNICAWNINNMHNWQLDTEDITPMRVDTVIHQRRIQISKVFPISTTNLTKINRKEGKIYV